TRQPEPGLDLRTVVAGVQDPPPERPDPLPSQPIEERYLRQPPLGAGRGKLRQPSLRQQDIPLQVRSDRRLLVRTQELLDERLLDADELGEEPALRQDLVDEDGPNRVRLLMRSEVEEVVRGRPPNARGLVGLAGVGRDDVLEERVWCERNDLVGNGDGLVS